MEENHLSKIRNHLFSLYPIMMEVICNSADFRPRAAHGGRMGALARTEGNRRNIK